MRNIVNSLWIGRIGPLEQLSLRSFVRHGYQVRLWTYGELQITMPGVSVMNANDILPAALIPEFRYSNSSSFSAFSNVFRYKLLADHGGIWVDLDNVCLKSRDVSAEYVFPSLSSRYHLGRETSQFGGVEIDSWFIKSPINSPMMRYCFSKSYQYKGKMPKWGTLGPVLLNEAVRRFDLLPFANTHFMPINWQHAHRYFADDFWFRNLFSLFRLRSWTAHLYRETLRAKNLLKPDAIHERSVLYRLFKENSVDMNGPW